MWLGGPVEAGNSCYSCCAPCPPMLWMLWQKLLTLEHAHVWWLPCIQQLDLLLKHHDGHTPVHHRLLSRGKQGQGRGRQGRAGQM